MTGARKAKRIRKGTRASRVKKNLWIILLLFVYFVLPAELRCEFYKYVDQDGKVVFVDDVGKIPPEYRDDLNVYKEKYDHLPPEQRAIMLEKERKDREKERAEQIAKERYLRRLDTKVTIKGNLVLVPVKLGYGGNKIEALLLLDTGASIVTLHQQIADRLHIREVVEAETQVAGGQTIKISVAKLDYVEVGPFKKANLYVGIIEHEGPAVAYDGLLGMNFLRNLEYGVDFKKQLIRWKP
jgi:predicted aspartyl protease